MPPNEAERIAALETELSSMKEDLAEIKADLKTLITAYHQQRGFIAATALIFTTIGGLAASAWDHIAQALK